MHDERTEMCGGRRETGDGRLTSSGCPCPGHRSDFTPTTYVHRTSVFWFRYFFFPELDLNTDPDPALKVNADPDPGFFHDKLLMFASRIVFENSI